MSFERSPLEVTNDNTSVGQKFFNPIFLAHLVGFFYRRVQCYRDPAGPHLHLGAELATARFAG